MPPYSRTFSHLPPSLYRQMTPSPSHHLTVPVVTGSFILIRPLLLHLAFKVMNGICYISTKRGAKLLHYFMIIVFHPLVYPVKHNPYKSILVKVCDELLISLRKIIPCTFLIDYIRYELIRQLIQIVFYLSLILRPSTDLFRKSVYP